MYSLASAGYKETKVMFNKGELSKFDAQIRMAEGSLRKAAPVLNLMSKNITDELSIGYRLKTFFNHFIRNSNSSMDKVFSYAKTIQRLF